MKIFKRRGLRLAPLKTGLASILAVLSLAGVMWVLSALAYASEQKPDAADVFVDKCSMCHGENGKGYSFIHSPDFTDPKWQASIKDAQILDAIKHGVKGTAMPSWSGKLSEKEILALLKYVREFGKKK